MNAIARAFSPQVLVLLFCCGWCLSAAAGVVIRQELEPGVHAAIDNGRTLFLECRPPRGDAAKALLGKYLAETEGWRTYKDRIAVAIPYMKLNGKARRQTLEALFPQDYVDSEGWWHTVTYSGTTGGESLFTLAEWLTGVGTNNDKLRKVPANAGIQESLQQGQRVLVPMSMLLPEMKAISKRVPPLRPAASTPDTEQLTAALIERAPDGVLDYGQDSAGGYAVYKLKKGEALYTSVVVRFTDYSENADIHAALKVIQQRSRIPDLNKVEVGQAIRIPVEMLSDRYQPAQSAQRMAYDAVRQEAEKLRTVRFNAQSLDGVVVILDPGHGGRDHGASHGPSGLYEDEINYDIVCRIKALLEQQTKARVYVTLEDPNQGYTSANVRRFVHDDDEHLLTTPKYHNNDAKISANLRFYLANKIYREELKRGTDEGKILFASIHCDALYNDKMRGAMVYIPGAEYRRDREQPGGAIYASYQEVKAQPSVTTDATIRRRDEAVSLNFANTLLRALRTNNPPIKVHDTGDPIRNVIRQSGGRAYVPAVLRNTMVPTKVLVETANLTNAMDRERLSDPQWRQWFAEAFVVALKDYYD